VAANFGPSQKSVKIEGMYYFADFGALCNLDPV
jgi:hypothetical protein